MQGRVVVGCRLLLPRANAKRVQRRVSPAGITNSWRCRKEANPARGRKFPPDIGEILMHNIKHPNCVADRTKVL